MGAQDVNEEQADMKIKPRKTWPTIKMFDELRSLYYLLSTFLWPELPFFFLDGLERRQISGGKDYENSNC